MSAFLGKIHYWLYDKIKLHEKLIETIVGLAEMNGYNSQTLLNESYSKYGFPVIGLLENEIEHTNIHGWLQERIISVESRMAYVITELLSKNVITKEDIADIFYQNARSIMLELRADKCFPQDLFNLIFDYMIEGMPCDRVNEIIENNELMIKWRIKKDLHKDYWNSVKGNVDNFYYFRDSWINGLLSANSTGYRYIRTEDGINTIRKV